MERTADTQWSPGRIVLSTMWTVLGCPLKKLIQDKDDRTMTMTKDSTGYKLADTYWPGKWLLKRFMDPCNFNTSTISQTIMTINYQFSGLQTTISLKRWRVWHTVKLQFCIYYLLKHQIRMLVIIISCAFIFNIRVLLRYGLHPSLSLLFSVNS